MTALGGLTALAPRLGGLPGIRRRQRRALLDVPVSALVAANEASSETKDLMIIAAFHQSALRRGHAPEVAADLSTLATIAKTNAVQAMRGFC